MRLPSMRYSSTYARSACADRAGAKRGAGILVIGGAMRHVDSVYAGDLDLRIGVEEGPGSGGVIDVEKDP